MNEKLEKLKRIPYRIEVRRKEGGYLLGIPELSCYVDSSGLDDGLAKLEIEKEKYFENMISLNREAEIIVPGGLRAKDSALRSLLYFFVKALIVFVFVLATLSFSEGLLLKLTDNAMTKGRDIIKQEMTKMAAPFLSSDDEEFERYRRKIRKWALRLKPLVNECMTILTEKEGIDDTTTGKSIDDKQ